MLSLENSILITEHLELWDKIKTYQIGVSGRQANIFRSTCP